MVTAVQQRKDFAIMDLNPCVRARFSELITRASTVETQTDFRFSPFEGYRSPERQQYLLAVEKATKAGPWQSAHQYGLAVDFAGYRINPVTGRGQWTWNLPLEAWQALRHEAAKFSLLLPIEWDKGHVQAPEFYEIRRAWRN